MHGLRSVVGPPCWSIYFIFCDIGGREGLSRASRPPLYFAFLYRRIVRMRLSSCGLRWGGRRTYCILPLCPYPPDRFSCGGALGAHESPMPRTLRSSLWPVAFVFSLFPLPYLLKKRFFGTKTVYPKVHTSSLSDSFVLCVRATGRLDRCGYSHFCSPYIILSPPPPASLEGSPGRECSPHCR